ncbi:MAG TPA: hypothetical protein DD502_12915, partial [Cupriavidus sp.]|nr:hypothetical protein [Cupriavidus sp.]
MAVGHPNACKIVAQLRPATSRRAVLSIVEVCNRMLIRARWPLRAAGQCFCRRAVVQGWAALSIVL